MPAVPGDFLVGCAGAWRPCCHGMRLDQSVVHGLTTGQDDYICGTDFGEAACIYGTLGGPPHKTLPSWPSREHQGFVAIVGSTRSAMALTVTCTRSRICAHLLQGPFAAPL